MENVEIKGLSVRIVTLGAAIPVAIAVWYGFGFLNCGCVWGSSAPLFEPLMLNDVRQWLDIAVYFWIVVTPFTLWLRGRFSPVLASVVAGVVSAFLPTYIESAIETLGRFDDLPSLLFSYLIWVCATTLNAAIIAKVWPQGDLTMSTLTNRLIWPATFLFVLMAYLAMRRPTDEPLDVSMFAQEVSVSMSITVLAWVPPMIPQTLLRIRLWALLVSTWFLSVVAVLWLIPLVRDGGTELFTWNVFFALVLVVVLHRVQSRLRLSPPTHPTQTAGSPSPAG